MIVFLGDRPGKKNKDTKIPFVGTRSYKTLLDWIYKMDINITDVILKNQVDILFDFEDLYDSMYFKDKIWIALNTLQFVALGKNASNTLKKHNVPHFELPHPSGSNLRLNDKKYVDEILKECQDYLNK